MSSGRGSCFCFALTCSILWSPMSASACPVGDLNGDNRLLDHAVWSGCVAGPNAGPPGAKCAPMVDGDFDHDVDLFDWSTLQIDFGAMFSGPIFPVARYRVDSMASPAAVGDLDGDNHIDLAIADSVHHRVSILINRGGATYAPVVQYDAGEGANFVAVGDSDGDGASDLALTNATIGAVSILRNHGDGTFAAPVPYGAGDTPHSVAFGDFDAETTTST